MFGELCYVSSWCLLIFGWIRVKKILGVGSIIMFLIRFYLSYKFFNLILFNVVFGWNIWEYS